VVKAASASVHTVVEMPLSPPELLPEDDVDPELPELLPDDDPEDPELPELAGLPPEDVDPELPPEVDDAAPLELPPEDDDVPASSDKGSPPPFELELEHATPTTKPRGTASHSALRDGWCRMLA
jgi:hypothetical protein